MRKIDCYAGSALCILFAVTLLRYDGYVRALEDETTEVIEADIEEIVVPEPDYEALVASCYAYIKSMNLQIVERVGMEFADGLAVNRNDDFLYLADTVYFQDSLFIRFVGSQGRIVSALANPDRVYGLEDLYKLNSINSTDTSVSELCVLLCSLAENPESEMTLMDRQRMEYVFADSQIKQKLELELSVEGDVTVSYVNIGRTSRDLWYNDVVLVQLTHENELLTLLVKRDINNKVVNIDVL